MSTILKALKKLEQETQAAATAAGLPARGEAAAAGAPPGRGKRLWIGMGIAAGLLGLVLVIFLLLRPAAPPTQNGPLSQPVPEAPLSAVEPPGSELPLPEVFPPRQPGDPRPAAPAPAATPPAATATPPASDPRPAAPPQTTKAEAARPSAPASAATPAPRAAVPPATQPSVSPSPETAGPPVTAMPEPQTPPAPVPAPVAATPQETPEGGAADLPPATLPAEPLPEPSPLAKSSVPAAAAPAPEAAAPVDPYAEVPRLEENSPIDLQAISWSPAATDSIAVINNSVVHEGDSVEGYLVVKIRPDDVVLRRDGRLWRAYFSLR